MTRRCKLSRISKGLLFCAFVFVFAPPALIRAQAPSSITGTVLDPSGAPVVSTKVSAKNLETGGVRTVSTNHAGRYEILSLPVGRYEIKATKPGFADSLRTGIELSIGQEARMQALLCALALGSTLALRASVEHGGRLRWGGYVALAVKGLAAEMRDERSRGRRTE